MGLRLVGSGSGGVAEMAQHLTPDNVFYGLARTTQIFDDPKVPLQVRAPSLRRAAAALRRRCAAGRPRVAPRRRQPARRRCAFASCPSWARRCQ